MDAIEKLCWALHNRAPTQEEYQGHDYNILLQAAADRIKQIEYTHCDKDKICHPARNAFGLNKFVTQLRAGVEMTDEDLKYYGQDIAFLHMLFRKHKHAWAKLAEFKKLVELHKTMFELWEANAASDKDDLNQRAMKNLVDGCNEILGEEK